jgi:hypothetical protein
MRQNIRMQTADDLMIARVIRDQELRAMKIEPTAPTEWTPVTDADAEMAGYLMVFGVLLIVISLVLAFA